ncbi:MAG: hypothetical protein H0T62_06165 [Parachlamydiaceae bacterium]|nr:hypothetical protein [Parachlamydiaceae bacterium]
MQSPCQDQPYLENFEMSELWMINSLEPEIVEQFISEAKYLLNSKVESLIADIVEAYKEPSPRSELSSSI